MTLQQKALVSTPSEKVRQLLGQLESHIGKLDHDSREEALKIPGLFDSTYAALNRLQQEGVSLPAEEARFQTVSAQFEKKGGVFLHKIGGAHVLEAMRQQEQPDSDRWWWSVDHVLAARQKMRFRQQGKTLLIGGAIIAVLVLLYVLFLAPDKETRARLQLQQDAEGLAQEGSYAEALEDIHQALVYASEDVELLMWQGVLEALLGQNDAAEATFATAENIAGSRKQFLLERAQVYLSLYQSQALLDDAEAVVRLDPEAPEGYLYIAQAYAQMGDYLSAQDYFDKTATLAAAAGDTQLEAIARVQLAQLYQMMLASPAGTPTQAP